MLLEKTWSSRGQRGTETNAGWFALQSKLRGLTSAVREPSAHSLTSGWCAGVWVGPHCGRWSRWTWVADRGHNGTTCTWDHTGPQTNSVQPIARLHSAPLAVSQIQCGFTSLPILYYTFPPENKKRTLCWDSVIQTLRIAKHERKKKNSLIIESAVAMRNKTKASHCEWTVQTCNRTCSEKRRLVVQGYK